jgi:L-asparaginase
MATVDQKEGPGGPVDELWRLANRFQEWGAVNETVAVYVERPADDEYLRVVGAEGRDCHVTGSRQSGKTSLVRRAAARLEQDGMVVAFLDVGLTHPSPGMSVEEWATKAVARLLLSVDIDPEIKKSLVANRNTDLIDVLCVLSECNEGRRILLVLDEFDELEKYPHLARWLLQQLRGTAQGRPWAPALEHVQLTTVGVKSTARLFADLSEMGGAKELGGLNLWLDDFRDLDDRTVQQLASGFDGRANAEELARFALRFAGGYPHATTWVCREIILSKLHEARDLHKELTDRVARAKREAPPFLQVTDNYISEHGEVAVSTIETYLKVLSGRDNIVFDARDRALSLLQWSGLCWVSPTGVLRPRSELTASYFDLEWAQKKMAGLRRSRGGNRRRSRRTDKRICILATGGTIGMLEFEDGQVRAPEDPNELPFDEVNRIADCKVEELFSPGLDSADIGPDQWTAIATAISLKRAEEKFDGFVVTHGTDTLAYSASAAAFALGDRLSFPVVFTGSQTTFDIEHGDARTNLLRACLVACEEQLPEVVVCFGEFILRACRAEKRDDRRFNAFDSPDYPELGYVAEEVHLLPRNFRTSWEQLARDPVNLKPAFADGIMAVAQLPGARVEGYLRAFADDVTDGRGAPLVRGLVVQSLGAANVPSRDDRYSLVPLIVRARELDIPVVVMSEYPVHQRNLARYSPAAAAIHAGAIPTGNMTRAAVVTKLSWVIADIDAQVKAGLLPEGHRSDQVRERMLRDEVGEL